MSSALQHPNCGFQSKPQPVRELELAGLHDWWTVSDIKTELQVLGFRALNPKP